MSDDSANPNTGAAETILKAALAFSAAERAAYVAGACGDNQVLRQQVEALLRAQEAPPASPAKPPPSPASTIKIEFTKAANESIGENIGRYKLMEEIGEGGCGVVYVAEQSQPVRRRV